MSARHVHPWVFLVLILPFGVSAGYVQVTLGYQLKQAGVPVGQIAGLVALNVLPHTWKFFWSPVADVTLSPKRWYVLAGLLCAAGIAALGAFPATQRGLAMLSGVVVLMSLSATFVGMSVESLMAHCTPENLKGRAGGWFQAGNLGGSGLGGGLGLVLAERLPAPWMASGILGVLCLGCCLALAGLPAPARSSNPPGFVAAVGESLRDLWGVARTGTGLVGLILCFLPVGSGAAGGLWSSVATEWHASAEVVALVTGLLGGLVSAAGCLAGGWICDRLHRQQAYVWFGVLQAGSLVAMALLPRSPAWFIVSTSVYTFTSGLTYAGFSAFALEAIGRGAAATKYSAFASLSNVPIYYMTTLDGWAHDRWSSQGMLLTEVVLGLAGAAAFLALTRWLLPQRTPSPSPVSAASPVGG